MEEAASSALTPRGAATRARIVDAATDLMYALGVAQTSLDAVMAASGTSKSQLYHYFADKDDLIAAVIRRQTERVLQAHEPLLHRLDSIEKLRTWADAVVASQAQRECVGGCPIGSLAAELADSPRARTLLAASFEQWESLLATGFAAMQDRGALKQDVAPTDLATSVMAALQGGLLLADITRTTRPLRLAMDMALERVAYHATARGPAAERP